MARRHHTKIGARVRQVMAAGQLVGDALVETVMRDRLDEHDWNYGFVIDGFPRNRRQAEFFLESHDLDAVIYLDTSPIPSLHPVVSRAPARALGGRPAAEVEAAYQDAGRAAGRLRHAGP